MPRLIVATISTATLLWLSAPLALAETTPVPSLSQRLSSLQRHWAGDDEGQGAVKQVQHTEPAERPSRSPSRGPINQQPPRRSASGGLLSRDLFSALRGDEQPAASDSSDVGSKAADGAATRELSENRYADATPRVGSVFLGPKTTATTATPDLGTALATAAPQPTPAAPAATSSSTPSPARRPYAGQSQGNLDLITSAASSQETRSAAIEQPRVALHSPSTQMVPVPSGNSYATAADAARALAGPSSASNLYTPPTQAPTPSPSDIPATAAPLLSTIDSASRTETEPTSISTEAPTTIELPRYNDIVAEPAQESRAELQPDWGTAKTNPMRTTSNQRSPTPAGPPTTREGVLVEQRLPQVTTQVTGPTEILIGREANYRVTIENRGNGPANSLIAEITVPQWADVVHSKVNAGTIRHAGADEAGTQLRWELNSLEASATQTLDLALVPRTSQPLELGVTWRQAPIASTTRVVVQEPKLAMAISGPDEVFFGRPQSYRLTISNPGTGLAEKVVVQLMPPGGGQAVSSHRLDSLAPGEAKIVEVEITAREAGELAVSATASAEGGLTCEATQPIFCRKPELQVDWRGPDRKYAGTEGTWFFRVRNPGTAPADEVEFDVSLPTGFQFTSASEGYRHDEVARRVVWRVGTLRPGDDCYLEVRGVLNQPGNNSLSLAASTPGGDIHHTATAVTEVVALADLKLEVSDPKGPIAVGTEIDYEIVVNNRGLSHAEEVQIAGFFSAGVEPVSVQGGEAQIADGRVTLKPIPSLAPGQQVRIKIRAKGQMAGTHLFRAEVLCRDSEIKLAAEETTRYFADDTPAIGGDMSLDSASRENRFQQVR